MTKLTFAEAKEKLNKQRIEGDLHNLAHISLNIESLRKAVEKRKLSIDAAEAKLNDLAKRIEESTDDSFCGDMHQLRRIVQDLYDKL